MVRRALVPSARSMGGAPRCHQAPGGDLAARFHSGNLVARARNHDRHAMILGAASAATTSGQPGRVTLDDLFRRALARHPLALALADPPNRESFTDHPPRRLTYVDADRKI